MAAPTGITKYTGGGGYITRDPYAAAKRQAKRDALKSYNGVVQSVDLGTGKARVSIAGTVHSVWLSRQGRSAKTGDTVAVTFHGNGMKFLSDVVTPKPPTAISGSMGTPPA